MQTAAIFADLMQDLRYAARGLARRPTFTAIAVITLGLGIGGTTAMFSAVSALLLRPLPYRDPGQLMKVSLVAPAEGDAKRNDNIPFSYPKFTAFRDAQTVFAALSVFDEASFNVTEDEGERLAGEHVGAAYFPTLGVPMARGRNFSAEEDALPDAPKQVILADAYWRRRYLADPSIVGGIIRFDREAYRIIGVAAPGFRGLSGRAEVFVPVTTQSAQVLGQAQLHSYSVVARRKAGVTREQAKAAVRLIGARVAALYPDGAGGKKPWSAVARDLDEVRTAPLVRQSLFVLFGAVSFVLLIACVNVANLLVGRNALRRGEITVRLALGAGRGRIVRQLLTESVLLSFIGGSAALFVAWGGAKLLRGVDPAGALGASVSDGMIGAVGFPSIHLDATATAFAFLVASGVGVVFGLIPALQATSPSLTGGLKDGLRGTTSARGGAVLSARRLLVITEIALALVLLAGSGVMLRSLARLLVADPGFDPHGVLTFRISPPFGSIQQDSFPGFYAQMLGTLGALPGVRVASLSSCVPLSGACGSTFLKRLDRPAAANIADLPLVGVRWVTPGWFSAMRVPLKRGRLLTDNDRGGAQQVALINEAAAHELWPDEDPIGKRIELGGGMTGSIEVVGIVGDVRAFADKPGTAGVYISYFQAPQWSITAFVKTSGDPLALVAPARRALHDVAPNFPMHDVQLMDARVHSAMTRERFSAELLTLFAGMALALAMVGIYGVMSFAVAQRTREIGIRMALGATRADVLGQVLSEGVGLTAAGAVIGIAAALAFTTVLRALLFNVRSSDPATYFAIVAVLGVSATVACWIPASRASRVDPIAALRAD